MNSNGQYLRVYDEKMDLLYEVDKRSALYKSDEITAVLRKSKQFLSIGGVTCYRVLPETI